MGWGYLVVKAIKGGGMSRCMLGAVLLAFLGMVQAEERVSDSLTVFKPGDTARASAVNANFKLIMDRMNALALANQQLSGKIDSLQKSKPSTPNVDSLETKIAGMKIQIQILHTRVDSTNTRAREKVPADSVVGLATALAGKAGISHVHSVSQVIGLQDSLNTKVAAKGGPLKVCSGRSNPATGWVSFNAYTDYIDVNTEACGFTSVPQYITSLGGSNRHFTATGATSIYSPTATGFRVYVTNQPWATTSEKPNEEWNWYINWVAIGP